MSTILNPTTGPVTFSDDARVIAAGERLDDIDIDATGRAAIKRGDLVEEDGQAQGDPAPEAEQDAPGQDAEQPVTPGAPDQEVAN